MNRQGTGQVSYNLNLIGESQLRLSAPCRPDPIKASDLETYSSSAGTLRSDVKPITPLVDKESTANFNQTKTYERRAGQSVSLLERERE